MTFKHLIGFIALMAAATASVAAGALPAVAAPVEGTDYVLIDNPDQPSGSKVQVTEVFSYGCIHCAHFQPYLVAWEKKLPSDVQFNYLPAAFGGTWDEWARAYYAAQILGVQKKSHDNIYKAVFDDHRVASSGEIPAIYADYGVNPTVFASTMHGDSVNASIAAAHEQIAHWGVDGTPTIVVDGQYRASITTDGGPEALLRTVDWLIARQRSAHAGH